MMDVPTDPTSARERWTRLAIAAWAIVGVLVLLAAAGWVLWRVSAVLVPLLIAAVVVLTLRGPVYRLQKRGVSRALGAVILYLVALFAISFAGLFLVPPFVEQAGSFAREFPRYYDAAYEFGQELLKQYKEFAPEWLYAASEEVYLSLGDQVGAATRGMARGALSAGGRLVGGLFNLVLGLVIAFWMLRDLPAIREELLALAGPRRRDEARLIFHEVSFALGGYLRGLAVVSSVTAVLVASGLWIADIPYPVILGLLTGVLNVVPYIGPAVAAVVAAIVAGFDVWWLAFVAAGIIFAAQQITDLFVTPRVMSEQVDLHPVLVILSLLVGGTLFGFWGLVLAIPLAAASKGLFVYYFEKHTSAQISSRDGALFRHGRCAGESAEATEDAGGRLARAKRMTFRRERAERDAGAADTSVEPQDDPQVQQ